MSESAQSVPNSRLPKILGALTGIVPAAYFLVLWFDSGRMKDLAAVLGFLAMTPAWYLMPWKGNFRLPTWATLLFVAGFIVAVGSLIGSKWVS